jgi:hypothetical protein
VQRLHAPAAVDEPSGQPVEQFRMARRFGAQAEVARGFHQSGAEMVLPHAIDHHPRGQRIGRTGDGAGEFEAAGAVLERPAGRAGQHLEELARHLGAQVRRQPAVEDARVRAGIALGQHQRGRRAEFDQAPVDLSLQPPQLLGRGGGEKCFVVYDAGVGHRRRRVRVAQKRPQLGRTRCLAGGLGLGKQFPVTFGGFARGGRRRGESGGDQRIEAGFLERVAQCRPGHRREFRLGNGRQRVPRPKNRMRRALREMQEVAPPPHRGGNQIIRGQDLVEALLGILFQLKLGRKVLADARPQPRPRLLAARRHRLRELFAALRQLCIIAGRQRDQSVVAASEHAVQRIIIGRRHRVVLVVVAPRAGHRQAHGAASDHVDAVIDDVMGHPDEPPPAGEKSHGREVGRIGRLEPVGRQLQKQKPVVRKVVVEGPNHPVAIRRRMHELPLLAAIDIPLGVRIPRHVQPVTPPAFAVARAGQQAVDQRRHRRRPVGRGCFDKSVDLVRGRGQPGQVKTHPADDRACIRRPGRRETGRFQPRQDESIDIGLDPVGPLDRGRR